MQTTSNRTTLSALASLVRSALADVRSAADEASVAAAFAALETAIEQHLTRSEELREEFYKQKNTITKQAAQLAEADYDAPGERAPAPPGEAHVTLQLPEIVTVESHPNCLFVRLQSGALVNLLQVAYLCPKTNMLYLTSGNVLTLEARDLTRLAFHCNLFTAEAPSGINPNPTQ